MKKISVHYLLALLLLCSLFSCTEDSNTNTSIQNSDTSLEAKQLLNIAYGNDSSQVYDIYLPENRNLNTKVIILIHGGGWTSGDKTDMNSYKDITQEEFPEYAIVNINYRLASQGVSPFPMQLNDITAVVNHLKLNQEEYSISNNFGFIGVSAGAHLAMLWSYSYDVDNNTKMVASIVGPTNLADTAYANNPQLPIDQLILYFGLTPTTVFLETYSPFHQAETTSPPTILFYGGMDPLIPNSQGIDMDAKLTELNIIHEFTFYPNEGHGWTGTNLFDTWSKLKSFIIAHH